jgi:hypothetical protein
MVVVALVAITVIVPTGYRERKEGRDKGEI